MSSRNFAVMKHLIYYITMAFDSISFCLQNFLTRTYTHDHKSLIIQFCKVMVDVNENFICPIMAANVFSSNQQTKPQQPTLRNFIVSVCVCTKITHTGT